MPEMSRKEKKLLKEEEARQRHAAELEAEEERQRQHALALKQAKLRKEAIAEAEERMEEVRRRWCS